MTTEVNKAFTLRYFEAVNARDMSVLDKLADEVYTADYILHDPGFPDLPRGPAGAKQAMRQIFQGMPDMVITVEDLFGEGDRLACRFTASGTNASTGKRERLPIVVISRFAGGKFAEEWEFVGPPQAEP